MITAPGTGELVVARINPSEGNNLKRFKAHQPATLGSSGVEIVTPFFDFGTSGNKKRLYKVRVLYHGPDIDSKLKHIH